MRRTTIAVLAAASTMLSPALAQAHDGKEYKSKRAHLAAHGYPKCKTWKCAAKAKKDPKRMMRKFVIPYRPWLRSTRWCESTNNHRANTGNGFYGWYQFTLSSWKAVGGSGMPNEASKLEQSYRAVKLLHLQGRGAWPVCG